MSCQPPYYPEEWNRIARKIKEESRYTCQNCLVQGGPFGPANIHVHHIVPVKRGGSHLETNLVPLCSKCHLAADNEEKMARVVPLNTGWEIPEREFNIFREWMRSAPWRPQGGDGIYAPLGELKIERSVQFGS